jgi:hypothetical protein
MDARRDDLSTADLAGDRPRDDVRDDDLTDDDRDDDLRDGDLTADLPPDDAAYSRADTVDRADTGTGETVQPVPPMGAPGPEPGFDRATAGTAGTTAAPPSSQAPPAPAPVEPLLDSGDSERYQARWTDIQNGFVDEPRQATEAADGLVAELMQHLAKTFADERDRLEGQWARGDDVSTDELRVAFQRYRTFFSRLLST